MCCSFYTIKAWTFFSADYHSVINPEHPLQGLGANSGTPCILSHTECLKIGEFRIQSVVEKDPVELEKYLEKKLLFLKKI
jgi:hypothetical protein